MNDSCVTDDGLMVAIWLDPGRWFSNCVIDGRITVAMWLKVDAAIKIAAWIMLKKWSDGSCGTDDKNDWICVIDDGMDAWWWKNDGSCAMCDW